MDSGDVLRYGLYALTVILGLALLTWTRRSRRIGLQNAELLRNAQRAENTSRPETRVTAVRGMRSTLSMANAIEGIRLPPHWEPDPSVDVTSPLTFTTDRETEGEVAELLSDELVRLGYRVRPTGPRSACAIRDTSSISIEVEAFEPDSVVTSRLTLTDVGRG